MHFKVTETAYDRVVMHHGESPATLTLSGLPPDAGFPERGDEFMVTIEPAHAIAPDKPKRRKKERAGV